MFLLPDADAAESLRLADLAKKEYAFRCRLCGTTMYAHPGQQGTTIKCPDCDTSNTVPPPPAPKKKISIPEDPDPYRLQGDERQETEGEGEPVRVHCSTCEAMMYARRDQIGKFVPCIDCGRPVLVRKPPKRAKAIVTATDPHIRVEPTFERVSEKQSFERFKRSAAVYAENMAAKRPTPPRHPFWSGIYNFPFYPDILTRWVALSVLFMVQIPFVQVAAEAEGPEAIVVALPLFVAFSILSVVMVFVLSAMLMTIFHMTAGGFDKIVTWPQLDFFERVMCVLYPAGATIASTAPLGLLFAAWQSLKLSAVAQIVGLGLFFPLAFLSMVDSASPAMPYSRLVWHSVRQLASVWIRFHVATVPCWLLLGGWVAVAMWWPNEWIVGSVFVGFVVSSVVYFRLLGRLAWVIDQRMPSVEDEEENDE